MVSELNNIIRILLKEKIMILIFGVIGIFIALILLSFNQPKKYTVKFTVRINHPYFTDYLLDSHNADVLKVIDITKLKKNQNFDLQFYKPDRIYVAHSNNENFIEEIKKEIIKDICNDVLFIKDVIKKQSNYKEHKYKKGLIFWTNEDILQLDMQDLVNRIEIIFSETKQNNKKIIAIILGLFIGIYTGSIKALTKKN